MKIIGDQMVSTQMLRAIADMADAGAIKDFAVVAIMSDDGKAMDFAHPPQNPEKMIEMLNTMIVWVGNKDKHTEMAQSIAEWKAKGLVSADGILDVEKLAAMEGIDE